MSNLKLNPNKILALDAIARKSINSATHTYPKQPRYYKAEKSLEAFNLLRQHLDPYIGTVLQVEQVADIARAAAKVLDLPAPLVRPLIQSFNQCFIDAKTLDLLKWQIAGNVAIKNKALELFNNKPHEKGWMTGIIVEVVIEASNRKPYGKVKLVSGPGAGFFIYLPLPIKGLRVISKTTVACVKHPGCPARHLADLKGLTQFQVTIYLNGLNSVYEVKANSKSMRIIQTTNYDAASWLKTTPKQKKHNKELMLERSKPCPYGLPNTCPECKIGYDRCARSCRPKTVVNSNSVEFFIKGKNICQKSLEKV